MHKTLHFYLKNTNPNTPPPGGLGD